VKIVLTIEKAALVVVTQDENEEKEERDEMLINGPDRLALCLPLLFPFSFFFFFSNYFFFFCIQQ
jgi:hypothetical protein